MRLFCKLQGIQGISYYTVMSCSSISCFRNTYCIMQKSYELHTVHVGHMQRTKAAVQYGLIFCALLSKNIKKVVKWHNSGIIMYSIQCSSDMSEPKYTRNSRQPNTRIRVCIYAHTRIQYIRVCLIRMYELTYCFFFS